MKRLLVVVGFVLAFCLNTNAQDAINSEKTNPVGVKDDKGIYT